MVNPQQYKIDQDRVKLIASGVSDTAAHIGTESDLEPPLTRSVLFQGIKAAHATTSETTVESNIQIKDPCRFGTTNYRLNRTVRYGAQGGTEDTSKLYFNDILLNVGDRFLIADPNRHTDGNTGLQQNGIWVVKRADGASVDTFERASDANEPAELIGAQVAVLTGELAGNTFVCTNTEITTLTTTFATGTNNEDNVIFKITQAAGSGALGQLTDVTITQASSTSLLSYDGDLGEWKNITLADLLTMFIDDLIVAKINEALAEAGSILTQIGASIASWWEGIIGMGIWEKISGFATDVWDKMVGVGTAIWDIFTDIGSSLWTELQKIFNYGYVRDETLDPPEYVTDTSDSKYEAWSLSRWFTNFFIEASSALTSVVTDIVNGLEIAAEAIGSFTEQVWNWFKFVFRLGFRKAPDDSYADENGYLSGEPAGMPDEPYVNDDGVPNSDDGYEGNAWMWQRWWKNAWLELDTYLEDALPGIWPLLKKFGKVAWGQLLLVFNMGYHYDDTDGYITDEDNADFTAWNWSTWFTNVWREITSRVADWLTGSIGSWWDTIKDTIVYTANAIWTWLDTTLGQPIRDALKGFVQYGFERTSGDGTQGNPYVYATTGWSITNFVTNMVADATNWLTSVGTAVTNWWNTTANWLTGVEGAITTWWSTTVNTVAAAGNAIWDALTAIGSTLVEEVDKFIVKGYARTEVDFGPGEDADDIPTGTKYELKDGGYWRYNTTGEWTLLNLLNAVFADGAGTWGTAFASSVQTAWNSAYLVAGTVWNYLNTMGISQLTTLSDWAVNGLEEVYEDVRGGIQMLGWTFVGVTNGVPNEVEANALGFLDGRPAVNDDSDTTNDLEPNEYLRDGVPYWNGEKHPWSITNVMKNFVTISAYGFWNEIGRHWFGMDEATWTQFYTALSGVTSVIFTKIKDVGDTLWGYVEGFLDLGYKTEVVNNAVVINKASNWHPLNIITNLLLGASHEARGAVIGTGNAFVEAAKALAGMMTTQVTEFANAFVAWLSDSGNVVKNAISNSLSDVFAAVGGAITGITEAIEEFLFGTEASGVAEDTIDNQSAGVLRFLRKIKTDAAAQTLNFNTFDISEIDRIFFNSNDGVQINSQWAHITGWGSNESDPPTDAEKNVRSMRFHVPSGGLFQFTHRREPFPNTTSLTFNNLLYMDKANVRFYDRERYGLTTIHGPLRLGNNAGNGTRPTTRSPGTFWVDASNNVIVQSGGADATNEVNLSNVGTGGGSTTLTPGMQTLSNLITSFNDAHVNSRNVVLGEAVGRQINQLSLGVYGLTRSYGNIWVSGYLDEGSTFGGHFQVDGNSAMKGHVEMGTNHEDTINVFGIFTIKSRVAVVDPESDGSLNGRIIRDLNGGEVYIYANSKRVAISPLANVATPTTTFIGLTDTPGDFTGQAGKILKVNSAADALEFTDEGSGGSLTRLTANLDGNDKDIRNLYGILFSNTNVANFAGSSSSYILSDAGTIFHHATYGDSIIFRTKDVSSTSNTEVTEQLRVNSIGVQVSEALQIGSGSFSSGRDGYMHRGSDGKVRLRSDGRLFIFDGGTGTVSVGTGGGGVLEGEDALAPTAIDNLQAFYKFEDNLDDSSDNGNDASLRSASQLPTYGTPGKHGKFLSGANSNIFTPSLDVDANSDWTIAFWGMAPTGSGSSSGGLIVWNSAYNVSVTPSRRPMGIHIYLNGTQLRVNAEAGGSSNIRDLDASLKGVWAHYMLVRSGSSGTFYVNGVAQGTSFSVTDTASISNNSQLTVGYHINNSTDSSLSRLADIDSLRVYNKALNTTERNSIAEVGIVTPTPIPEVTVSRIGLATNVLETQDAVFKIAASGIKTGESLVVFFSVSEDKTNNQNYVSSTQEGAKRITLDSTSNEKNHTVTITHDGEVNPDGEVTLTITPNSSYTIGSGKGSVSYDIINTDTPDPVDNIHDGVSLGLAIADKQGNSLRSVITIDASTNEAGKLVVVESPSTTIINQVAAEVGTTYSTTREHAKTSSVQPIRYTITGTDASGNVATFSQTINVPRLSDARDTTDPVLSMLVGGAVVNNTTYRISYSVSVSNEDAEVEVVFNGVTIDTIDASEGVTYTGTHDVSRHATNNIQYTIQATATDDAGNDSTVGRQITVPKQPAVNTPPTLEIDTSLPVRTVLGTDYRLVTVEVNKQTSLKINVSDAETPKAELQLATTDPQLGGNGTFDKTPAGNAVLWKYTPTKTTPAGSIGIFIDASVIDTGLPKGTNSLTATERFIYRVDPKPNTRPMVRGLPPDNSSLIVGGRFDFDFTVVDDRGVGASPFSNFAITTTSGGTLPPYSGTTYITLKSRNTNAQGVETTVWRFRTGATKTVGTFKVAFDVTDNGDSHNSNALTTAVSFDLDVEAVNVAPVIEDLVYTHRANMNTTFTLNFTVNDMTKPKVTCVHTDGTALTRSNVDVFNKDVNNNWKCTFEWRIGNVFGNEVVPLKIVAVDSINSALKDEEPFNVAVQYVRPSVTTNTNTEGSIIPVAQIKNPKYMSAETLDENFGSGSGCMGFIFENAHTGIDEDDDKVYPTLGPTDRNQWRLCWKVSNMWFLKRADGVLQATGSDRANPPGNKWVAINYALKRATDSFGNEGGFTSNPPAVKPNILLSSAVLGGIYVRRDEDRDDALSTRDDGSLTYVETRVGGGLTKYENRTAMVPENTRFLNDPETVTTISPIPEIDISASLLTYAHLRLARRNSRGTSLSETDGSVVFNKSNSALYVKANDYWWIFEADR